MRCPRCGETKADKFGVCRARQCGRNLYCRSCCREKTDAVRSDPLSQATPIARVRNAIAEGYRTQKTIKWKTGLSPDKIANALAELMLVEEEVGHVRIDGEPIYFMKEPKAA